MSPDPRIHSDRVESPNSQSGSLKVRVRSSTYSHPLASKLVHSSIQDTAPMAIDLTCILFYFFKYKKKKEKKIKRTLEYNPIKQWTENLYRNVSKEDIQLGNMDMKRYSNMTNHQENAHQNHNKISPHTRFDKNTRNSKCWRGCGNSYGLLMGM